MNIANRLLLIGIFATLLAACDTGPQPAVTATPVPVATALVATTPSIVPATSAPVSTKMPCSTPTVTGKLNLLPLPGIVRGPAGMAMFQGRFYMAGSRSNNVGVIDNGQLSSVFATGGGPRALVADNAMGKLFVLNADELSISMSDGQKVQATIPISNTALAQLHQEPREMVIDTQHHRLYVGINTSRPEIAVIDTQAFTISARVVFTNSHYIGPMALDAVNNRLFFAHSDVNGDNISVLDLQTRQITEKIGMGTGPHGTLVYDAASQRLYTDYSDPKAGGRGIVIDKGNEVGSFPAPIGPSDWLIVNRRLYMSNVFSSTVDVVDLQTNQQIASIGVGLYPNALLADPVGERIYVSVRGAQNSAPESNRLEVIDTRRSEVAGLVPLAAASPQLIGDATRHRLYALLPSSSEAVISDGQRILARVKLERAPFQMALDERAGRLYVGDDLAHIISVIDVTAGQAVARVTPAIPADRSGVPSFMEAVAVDTRHNRLLVNNAFFPLDQLNATGNYGITGSLVGESSWPRFWLTSPSLPRYYGIGGVGLKSSFLLLAYDSETLQAQYSGIADVSALTLDDGTQRLYAAAEALAPAGLQTTLYVRDALSLSPIASLSLPARVTALALNAKTHHLFMSYLAQASLPNAANNTVEVIDTRTLSRVATFWVSDEPIAMAVLDDNVYIVSSSTSDLTIVADCPTAVAPQPSPTALPAASPLAVTPIPSLPPTSAPSGDAAYDAFARSLKAAVENNDEGALKRLVAPNWTYGPSRAGALSVNNVDEFIAAWRAYRDSHASGTLIVDLERVAWDIVKPGKLGERILVACWQTDGRCLEFDHLYASRVGGQWRWATFVFLRDYYHSPTLSVYRPNPTRFGDVMLVGEYRGANSDHAIADTPPQSQQARPFESFVLKDISGNSIWIGYWSDAILGQAPKPNDPANLGRLVRVIGQAGPLFIQAHSITAVPAGSYARFEGIIQDTNMTARAITLSAADGSLQKLSLLDTALIDRTDGCSLSSAALTKGSRIVATGRPLSGQILLTEQMYVLPVADPPWMPTNHLQVFVQGSVFYLRNLLTNVQTVLPNDGKQWDWMYGC